ncbi:SagB family peptide dehydrogenase [Myxococcus sp. CA051A]|uniref:SagB/ThcOx family dehydrogenase n=1 Tax=Myxococcus sp. CA051A TaxID=2741739 RepID=UPI00157AFCB6|nr:SagB family peptide dehydrogenase [Myxococcus sp. CA051A]NTX65589.1 SagB family peptide dehydrogenase [Myxococcus sp. CA051A]
MRLHESFGLTPGIKVHTLEDGRRVVASPRFGLEFGGLSAGARAALQQLETGGTEHELLDTAEPHDGPTASLLLDHLLQSLARNDFLYRTLLLEDAPLATLLPSTAPGHSEPRRPEAKYVLSRLACVRREDHQLVVEVPASHARVLLRDTRAAALLPELSSPRSLAELTERAATLPIKAVDLLLGVLLDAKAVHVPEEEDAALALWEPEDLLFHGHSRLGRLPSPYGATYRFEHRMEPLPALKPRMTEAVVPLPRPDLKRLSQEDAPFTQVLERRRSLRTYGEPPISLEQLGELLYRAARTRRVLSTEHGELGERPYPGGGALYELELYLVVDRCEGLESGLYQYRSGQHELCKLTPRTQQVEQLLEGAWHTLAREGRPQVLLVITARFPRVFWKYQAMGYALILKNVGVLFQTLYLAATAMDLAPCALGGGDSELFARASGIPPLAEGAVGEFALGTRAKEDGT